METMGKIFLGVLTLAVLMLFVLPVVGVVLGIVVPNVSYSPAHVDSTPQMMFGTQNAKLILILLVAGAAFILLLFGLLVVFLRWIFGGRRRSPRQESVNETRLMQEIYRGLSRMDKRIESLETVLLGQEREVSDEHWK